MKDKRIIQAQKDFDAMIKNSSKKEIKNARSGCGIIACKFAHQYVKSAKDEQEVYKKIYNIYFNYFKGGD